MEIFNKFTDNFLKGCIVKNLKEDPVKLHNFNYSHIQSNNTEVKMREILENSIDYEDQYPNGYFFITKEKLQLETFQSVRKFFQVLCDLLSKYLSLEDETVQSMQLIDINNRNKLKNLISLFRKFLLQRFCKAYNKKDYDIIHN